MADLIVRLKKDDDTYGQSWRLRQSTLPCTVGSSQKASIQLGGLKGIEGAFEYQSGVWTYLSMQTETSHCNIEFKDVECEIKVGPYCLNVTPAKILRRPNLEALPTLDPVMVKQLSKRAPVTMTKTEKQIFAATLVVPLLFSLLGFVVPSQYEQQLAKEIYKPKPVLAQTRIEPPKEKKPLATPSREPAQGKKSNAPSSASSKAEPANPMLKIRRGSLSNLIGKVSARSAKSREVVIASGKAAGTQPSSRAFAVAGAVSKQVGQSGLNGIGDSDGVTVSTIGKGGGSSEYQGIGSMKAGGVGKGGLDIIEEETEIGGGLAREIIAEYIKSQLGQILYCYERQLSAQPDLFGKVAVAFTIGSTGKVVSQKIGTTSLKSSSVEGCILRKVAQWRFPQPEGGTQVNVTYPFLFKSTN